MPENLNSAESLDHSEDGQHCRDCGFVVVGGLCCRPGRERRNSKGATARPLPRPTPTRISVKK